MAEGESTERVGEEVAASGREAPPLWVHPGEILLAQFLEPLGVTQYRLAKATGVPPRRINEIVLGKRGITADTALRLGRFFGTAPELWMHLQNQYELDRASVELGDELARVEPLERGGEAFKG